MEKPRKILFEIKPEYFEKNLKEYPPEIRDVKLYLTSTIRGKAYLDLGFVTIPEFAWNRGNDYLYYYIAHELAHILSRRIYNDQEGKHDLRFYFAFKELCLDNLQHFELGYKPRAAKANGIQRR